MTHFRKWLAGAVAAGVLSLPVAAGAQGAGKKAKGAAKTQAKPGAAKTPKKSAGLTPAQLAALRADLFSRDADKALAAADMLGKQSTTTSDGPAVEILLDVLSMGTAPRVAMAALDALSFHRDPKALELLAQYSRNRNEQVRYKAYIALGETNDKDVVPHLMRGLHDSSASVRTASATALARKNEKGAVDTLIALLKRGDESAASALAVLATPELAAQLADMIGDVSDSLLAGTLGGILMRDDIKDEVKLEVVKALGKIPGESSLGALAEYVSAPEGKTKPASRVEAEKILEERQ